MISDDDDESDENVVDMDSNNALSDDDNVDQLVEDVLKHENRRSRQPISKQRLLSKRNLNRKYLNLFLIIY